MTDITEGIYNNVLGLNCGFRIVIENAIAFIITLG
jgi:hypothetical protein